MSYVRSPKNLTSEEEKQFAIAMSKVDTNDPAQLTAIAEVIVKELREEQKKDDMLNILGVEVQTFPVGTTPEFITRRGLKAYVHEPGTFAPRSVLTNKSQSLYTELVSVNPEIELSQLQSGRYGTIQSIRTEALDELLGRKYGIIWTTVTNSIASTDTNYGTIGTSNTAAVKRAAVDSGLDYVADIPGSRVTAIVGRRNTLKFLADSSAYSAPSEAKKGELDTNLYPGDYRGIPVVMLNQYQDGWGGDVIAENEIMILGSDTVKLGVNETLSFRDFVNADTLMWNIHMYERYGCGVFFPERNFRIVQS